MRDPIPTCPICLRKYEAVDVRPTVGSCGHTVCKGCRGRLQSPICPMPHCRRPEAFATLTLSYDMMAMIEAISEMMSKEEGKKNTGKVRDSQEKTMQKWKNHSVDVGENANSAPVLELDQLTEEQEVRRMRLTLEEYSLDNGGPLLGNSRHTKFLDYEVPEKDDSLFDRDDDKCTDPSVSMDAPNEFEVVTENDNHEREDKGFDMRPLKELEIAEVQECIPQDATNNVHLNTQLDNYSQKSQFNENKGKRIANLRNLQEDKYSQTSIVREAEVEEPTLEGNVADVIRQREEQQRLEMARPNDDVITDVPEDSHQDATVTSRIAPTRSDNCSQTSLFGCSNERVEKEDVPIASPLNIREDKHSQTSIVPEAKDAEPTLQGNDVTTDEPSEELEDEGVRISPIITTDDSEATLEEREIEREGERRTPIESDFVEVPEHTQQDKNTTVFPEYAHQDATNHVHLKILNDNYSQTSLRGEAEGAVTNEDVPTAKPRSVQKRNNSQACFVREAEVVEPALQGNDVKNSGICEREDEKMQKILTGESDITEVPEDTQQDSLGNASHKTQSNNSCQTSLVSEADRENRGDAITVEGVRVQLSLFHSADDSEASLTEDATNDGISGRQANPCEQTDVTENNITAEAEPEILEEVNVVVMGETGVGKSTWINAIANYIMYNNIEEAIQNPLINLIPTEFTISIKKDGEMIQLPVKVGSSQNEVTGTTTSCTQHPRSYVFTHNRKNYRIIDTPGIGDTRGLEKDRENIRNIIQYIAKYERIHAICVLMLPNQARLTASFEFCFKEIIMQFHKSAANNIVFCFTNTSGCGFCVGETHEPLKQLVSEIGREQHVNISLSENTMYPFDNMAYRYLCAKRTKNAEFSKVLEMLYQQSFIASRDETLRLFERINNMSPHKTEESVTLQYVREVIDKLTKPLAAINRMVTDVLAQIDDKVSEIDRNQNNKVDLEKTLMIKLVISHYEVRRESVEFCKRCSYEKEYSGAARDELLACDPTLADQDPLRMVYFENVETGEACRQCGTRDHIVESKKRYVRVTEDKEEEDANQRNRINTFQDLINSANTQLKEMRQLKKELETERKQIQKAAAMFAYFLKMNSITTYNDATEKYLKLLIEVAQNKNDRRDIKNLEGQLEQYIEQRKTFQESLRQADNVIREVTHKDVMLEAQNLQLMKHYGRDVTVALVQAQDNTNNVTEEELHFSPTTGRVSVFRNACDAVNRIVNRMLSS